MSNSEKQQAANIVWFEIPADNPERATAFYSNLFGWKINPFPGGGEYWHIDTGGADDTPDGALKRRKHLLGGKICMGKTAVPQMGYFAVCQDTEGNAFGIWQSDPNAK